MSPASGVKGRSRSVKAPTQLDYPSPIGEKCQPNPEIDWTGISKKKWFKHIKYTPHKGQVEFHESVSRFKVLFAGARFGKSCAAAREVEPLIMCPGTRGWIVAPSYDLGEREFRYIHTDLVVNLRLPTVQCDYNVRQGKYFIKFPWGAQVQVKSAMKENTLLGEELDWVIMAEAAEMRDTIWSRYIRMRLHTRKGIAIFATSPKGFGWVYKKAKLGTPHNEKWATFIGSSIDNPHNLDTVDEDEMSKEDYEEQVLGIPSARGGRCFGEFLRAVHVHQCRSWVLKNRHRLRIYNGIDFGYTHPFVCLWGARDKDGNWYVYREYYQKKKLLAEHIKHIKAFRRERLECRYADSADPESRREMAEANLETLKARKEIEPGIKSVKTLLIGKVPNTPSGRKMIVDPSCKELIRQLEDVPWQETRDSVKEVYVDNDNDCLDALRYMVYSVEGTGAWGI